MPVGGAAGVRGRRGVGGAEDPLELGSCRPRPLRLICACAIDWWSGELCDFCFSGRRMGTDSESGDGVDDR